MPSFPNITEKFTTQFVVVTCRDVPAAAMLPTIGHSPRVRLYAVNAWRYGECQAWGKGPVWEQDRPQPVRQPGHRDGPAKVPRKRHPLPMSQPVWSAVTEVRSGGIRGILPGKDARLYASDPRAGVLDHGTTGSGDRTKGPAIPGLVQRTRPYRGQDKVPGVPGQDYAEVWPENE